MARKIKTEKTKKKNKAKKIIIILLVLALIAGLSFFMYKKLSTSGKGPQTVVKVLGSLDEYRYILTDQDSPYYKKEYDTLKKILNEENVDINEYVKQVAKMFIIDLYTIDTKINKYDIGGYEFFYEDKADIYEQKVMDTLYSQVQDNTYGDRKQELTVVKNVEIISLEETEYNLGEEKALAYQVKFNITYEKDMGYDTEGTVMICKEKGIHWSVVDYQPTLSPKYEVQKK